MTAEVYTYIGAGGKTTSIFARARQERAAGRRAHHEERDCNDQEKRRYGHEQAAADETQHLGGARGEGHLSAGRCETFIAPR